VKAPHGHGDAVLGQAKLPASWAWATLDQLLAGIEAGSSFRCLERPPGAHEVGVVKVSAVTWGTYNDSESKTCMDAGRVDPELFIQEGDFLFSRANTIELVGACVIAGGVRRKVMLSDKILRLRFRARVERWVLWALRSRAARAQIEALATGNQESMRNIGQARIRQIRIPVAPLEEQHRIVAEIEKQFSRLHAIESGLKRLMVTVQCAHASVVDAALKGRFRAPLVERAADGTKRRQEALRERQRRWADRGPTLYQEPVAPADQPDALPEGWCWTTIDEILREPLRNGRSGRAAQSGIRTLTLTAVTARSFADENTKLTITSPEDAEDLWLESDDLLVQRSNTPALVGSAARYDGPPRWAIFPDLLIRLRALPNISARYIDLVLRSRRARHYFRTRAQGIAGSMPKISQDTLRSLTFPLATEGDEAVIVREAERHLSVYDALEAGIDRALARCEALRQSILRRAFEGRLVAQDPTDEPAEELLRRLAAAGDEVGRLTRPRRSPRRRAEPTAA
jgi:type I restriction enzyme S subunit